jgi:hypothetical protein
MTIEVVGKQVHNRVMHVPVALFKRLAVYSTGTEPEKVTTVMLRVLDAYEELIGKTTVVEDKRVKIHVSCDPVPHLVERLTDIDDISVDTTGEDNCGAFVTCPDSIKFEIIKEIFLIDNNAVIMSMDDVSLTDDEFTTVIKVVND